MEERRCTGLPLGWATRFKPPLKGFSGSSNWRNPSPSESSAKISWKLRFTASKASPNACKRRVVKFSMRRRSSLLSAWRVLSSCSRMTRDALVVAIDSTITVILVLASAILRSIIDRLRFKTKTICKW
jgi:hypothetical protein